MGDSAYTFDLSALNLPKPDGKRVESRFRLGGTDIPFSEMWLAEREAEAISNVNSSGSQAGLLQEARARTFA
jgi:hypothetical protein